MKEYQKPILGILMTKLQNSIITTSGFVNPNDNDGQVPDDWGNLR